MPHRTENHSPLMVLVLLAALLSARVGFAAEEQVAWHVGEAEVRIPLTVSHEEVLVKMPPEVYLADLNPIEAKDLAFDRKTKEVVLHDVRTPEEKQRVIADLKRQCAAAGQEYKPELYRPQWNANGSATFELKPEYKWFFCEFRGRALQVSVDGTNILQKRNWNSPLEAVAIPAGGKRLTIEANGNILRRAGFITRGPSVALATLYLPSLNPTEVIPLVYDLRGRQVGCRIVWVHPGEPMSILLDCSSGEEEYLVYLVPRSKQPARLDWAPKAGLILESRYPDRFDPGINTPEGFQKLWNESNFIAGKEAVTGTFVALPPGKRPEWDDPWRPEAAILHRFLPFRPCDGEVTNFRDARENRGRSLALTRYTGFFHIPETQDYEFYFGVQPGGYLLINDQMVAEWQYGETGQTEWTRSGKGQTQRLAIKAFKLKLEKGLHKLELSQYGQRGRFTAYLFWGIPGHDSSVRVFGHGFPVWEPLADTEAGAVTRRKEQLSASFAWDHAAHWFGAYPAGDIVRLSFTGMLAPERDDAVFRWRFDDGPAVEGKKVEHVFFAPGIRQVALEVLDGPGGKVLSRAAGNVHVHVNWYYPKGGRSSALVEPIARREPEFASVTPIRDVLSLYEWSLQWDWPEHQVTIASALAGRIDEVIGTCPYNRLLDLARSVPMAAHSSAVEKLCKTVMDRAPYGGRHWKSAATTLADILVSVRAEPEKALPLMERAASAEPSLDMTGGWRLAPAEQWYPSIPESGETAYVTAGTDWSEASDLPLYHRQGGGRGAWLAKELFVPDSRRGKELVWELRGMSGHGVTIWFNDERLDAPPQWPRDSSLVIPAEAQRFGETNRFLALHQPAEPPEWFGAKHLHNFGFAAPTAVADDSVPRITADALLTMGEEDKAKEILLNLKPDAWPLDEQAEVKLSIDLSKVQRRAGGNLSDAGRALPVLDEWQSKHPMLRTVPAFMMVKLEAYAGMGDYARALTLARQMLRTDLNEKQRNQVLLVQVQTMVKTEQMDAARDVYIKLKQTAAYSEATVEAREAITKAVLEE